jgi:hypothetical protein
MKTIKIEDEDYNFLQALVYKMTTQSNRATQYPLFVVMEDYEQLVPDGFGKEVRREGDCLDSSYLCEKCKELYDNGDDLPEQCGDCDSEAFMTIDIQERPNLNPGVFFTSDACDEHIKNNNYHYTYPRSYGIGNWRNEEMVEVMQLLFKLTGNPIPSCYQ